MTGISQVSSQSLAGFVKQEAALIKLVEAEFEGTVKNAEILSQEVLHAKKRYEGIHRAYGFYSKFSADWELVAESVTASSTHLLAIAELEDTFIGLKNILELNFSKVSSLKDLHLVTRSRAAHFTAVMKGVEANLKFYIHVPFLITEFNQIIGSHFMGSDFDSEEEAVNDASSDNEEEYSQVNYTSDGDYFSEASFTSLGEDLSQSSISSMTQAISQSSFTSGEEEFSQAGYITDVEESITQSFEDEDLDYILIEPGSDEEVLSQSNPI